MFTISFLAILLSLTSAQTCEFGVYNDNETLPLSQGWTRLDLSTLRSLKYQFIDAYNNNKYITAVSPGFEADNCAVCIENNRGLKIDGFSSLIRNFTGPLNCNLNVNNPYTKYIIWPFHIYSTSSYNSTFTKSSIDDPCEIGEYQVSLYYKGCTLSPTVAAPTASPVTQACFGVYSTNETLPVSLGWTRFDLYSLHQYKSQIVAEYNQNNGIDKIANFSDVFCGFFLNDTHFLMIDGDFMVLYNCENITEVSKFQFYDPQTEYEMLELSENPIFDYYYFDTDWTAVALYYKEDCFPPSTAAPTLTPSLSPTNDKSSDGKFAVFIPNKYRMHSLIISGVTVCLVIILCVCLCRCCFRKKKKEGQQVERQMSQIQEN